MTVGKSTRVLLLTRSFWPHSAGRHDRAAEAVRLARLWNRQFDVEVVTPRHAVSWPQQIHYDDIPVHRFVTSPKGHWSTSRYVKQVAQWLSDWVESQESDQRLVMVSLGIGDDCQAITVSLDRESVREAFDENRLTTVAISDGWGHDSDATSAQFTRMGRRGQQSLASLNYVVARSLSAQKRLVVGGVSLSSAQRLGRGFARPSPCTLQQRSEARRALAHANTDLSTEADERVLLWCGHMTGRPRLDSGVGRLIGSARLLCSRYPKLKIWLVGDGELHDWAHTELKAEGVRSVVAIPGSFTDLTDIYRAVDYVAITDEEQLRYTLPSALSVGLPMILRESAAITEYMSAILPTSTLDSFTWYEHDREASFRKMFRSLWDDMDGARQHATEVAQTLSSTHSELAEFEAWRKIFS